VPGLLGVRGGYRDPHVTGRVPLQRRRARYSGGRDPHVGAENLADALCHLPRARLADHPRPAKGLLRHAEDVALGLLRVDDQAPGEVPGGVGNVDDPSAEAPPGQGLRARQRQAALVQELPDYGLELVVVGPEHRDAEPASNLLLDRGDQAPGLLLGAGLGGEPDPDLPR
jgi:hypothetical protein